MEVMSHHHGRQDLRLQQKLRPLGLETVVKGAVPAYFRQVLPLAVTALKR